MESEFREFKMTTRNLMITGEECLHKNPDVGGAGIPLDKINSILGKKSISSTNIEKEMPLAIIQDSDEDIKELETLMKKYNIIAFPNSFSAKDSIAKIKGLLGIKEI